MALIYHLQNFPNPWNMLKKFDTLTFGAKYCSPRVKAAIFSREYFDVFFFKLKKSVVRIL